MGFSLPMTLWLQFDNCGENKNQYMFAYLSHLVQARKFTQIRVSFLSQFFCIFFSLSTKFVSHQINFLVVGHTHCPLDQYFSVLSKAILKAVFIASPEALMELFDTAHRSEVGVQRPVINKIVYAIWDWVQMYAPFINSECPTFFLIRSYLNI